ncbi:MAG: hypothetical protein J7L62_04285 [Candidatus Aminicenantes bacterium]|nr:hypothetical protein [Candidatus Aminicenantes bacterium]
MEFFVKYSTKLTDIILYPFKSLPSFWGILWLSFISAVIVLLVYKWVSSPALIRRAKNRIKADILAIRIYKDQWKVILISFFSAMFNVLKYFLLNLMPITVILPVLFFLFVQMEWRYGVRPLNLQEQVIVKVKTNGGTDINLHPTQFYKQEVKVRVPALDEVDFRVRILKKGKWKLILEGEGEKFEKEVVVEKRGEVLSPIRYSYPNLEMLLYPWEPLIRNPKIKWIRIEYPSTRVSFLGISMHWLIWYLILVVVLVLPVHKKFGIEF